MCSWTSIRKWRWARQPCLSRLKQSPFHGYWTNSFNQLVVHKSTCLQSSIPVWVMIHRYSFGWVYFSTIIARLCLSSSKSTMQPLAAAGASPARANTNLSTSVSLTVLDKTGSVVPISASMDHPIEFIIPQEVNVRLSPMTLQNVTSMNNIHNQIFNLHYVNITQSNSNLTVSLHFEMRPLDASVGYLLIFRFDTSPQLNSAINQTDGWSLLCPSSELFCHQHGMPLNAYYLDLTNDSTHTYFIDNQLSAYHRSVIFGLRELNSSEVAYFCTNNAINNGPPLSNQPFNFSSNYELRTFASGCYYLDSNNYWQSDGLLVSVNSTVVARLLLPLGWTFDKSLSNSMFINSSDNIRRWLFDSTSSNQLELCVC